MAISSFHLTRKIHFVALAALLIILTSLAAYSFYISERDSLFSQGEKELEAVADLKIKQIAAWYEDELNDTKAIATSSLLVEKLGKYLVNPGAESELYEFLQDLRLQHNYLDVLLFSVDGDLILSTKLTSEKVDSVLAKKIKESLLAKDVVTIDLHKSDLDDTYITLDYISPVTNRNNQQIAVIVLTLDAHYFLYPLLDFWPVSSRTAETLLLRKEGENILFLSELKGIKNSALTLRIPLSDKQFPSVQAVTGYKGIIKANDFSGDEVFAYVNRIPATPWFMMVKIDTDELFENIYSRLIRIIIIALLFILFTVSGLSFLYSYRQGNIYKELYRKEKELWQAEEKFKVTIDSLGNGVITTDVHGKITYMNNLAELLTGWSLREARGKILDQIYSVRNELTGKKENNIINDVLKSGILKELANHSVLINRHGQEIPVMDTGAPIYDIDGKIIGIVIGFQDETEKRTQQRLLKDSEARLNKAQRIASLGNWELDLKTNKLAWSDEVFRIFEIDKHRFDASYDTFLNAVHPDDRDFVNKVFTESLKNKSPFSIDHRVFMKENQIKFVHEQCENYFDEKGSPVRLVGTVQDITKRVLAEEKIRESRNRYNTLFNSMIDAFALHEMIFDENGKPVDYKFLEANPAFENLTSLSVDKIIGRTVKEVIPGIEDFWIQKYAEVVLTGIPQKFENFAAPLNKYYEVVAFRPQLNQFAVIFVDITERKLSEQKLILSNEQVKKLNRVYTVLSNVNQLIVRERDINLILESACRIAVNDGKFRMATIGLVDEEFQAVNFIAKAGYTKDYMDKINFKLNDEIRSNGPTGTAIRTRSHCIINNIESDERMLPWRDIALKNNYKSCASFPFIVFDKPYGALALYSDNYNFFDEDEMKLLDEMAMDISFAVESSLIEKDKVAAEEKLIESNKRFNRLVSELNDVVWTASIDGNRILDINDSFREIYGIHPDALKDNPKLWLEMVHPDDKPIAGASAAELRQTGKSQSEYRILKPDGSISWILDRKALIYDESGSPVQMGGIAKNITGQKIAEEELKRKGLLLIAMASSTSELLSNEIVEEALPNSLGFIGKAAFVDRVCIFRNHIDFDSNTWFTSQAFEWVSNTLNPQIDNPLFQNIPFSKLEPLIKTFMNNLPFMDILSASPDDEFKEILFSRGTQSLLAFPIFIKYDFWGFVCFDECKFERVWSDSELSILRSFAAALSSSIERDNHKKELQKAKEKAEEINKIKSHFFANMSHELRTPFVGIMGYAEILSESLTDPEFREMAEGILNTSLRMKNTLAKILSLTKYEFNGIEVKPNRTDITALLNTVHQQFSKTAEKKKLFFRKKINFEQILILTDEALLIEILNNLISNALIYTVEGGIELSANLEIRDNKTFLVIKVTDTGIGIPLDKHQVIWEEFRQASEGFSRSFEGTGLGLSIVKKYTELLGGNICLESEPAKGSTFTLVLPVELYTDAKYTDKSPLVTESAKLLQNVSRKSLLYVEDDIVSIDVVKRILCKRYEVDFATDPDSALKKVKDNRYDAILMDINLACEINGTELTAMIRKITPYQDIPIIAVTAYASDCDKEEFLSKGMSHYIAKPFSLNDLLKLLEDIFS